LTTQLTGRTLCNQVSRKLPVFASNGGCNNMVIGSIWDQLDNTNCMNRPTSALANNLGVDLGCTKPTHLTRTVRRYLEITGA
jgi:hypothetical protein